MKVLKETTHGILLNHFGIGKRFYLAVSVLAWFGFDDPDRLLAETDLWKTVPKELGPDGVLDQGMPKTRAELLVRGKCHAGARSAIPAADVRVRLGPVDKRLLVFGDRFWTRGAGGWTITDPVPFEAMDVDAAHALGGPEWACNRAGKGIDPARPPDQAAGLPLPNIELPQLVMGTPADRPGPALLTPLDILHPDRQKKLGTYDERWRRERWPYYPEDMDWSYWNCAPPDQQLPGFLHGGETFECHRMHPAKAVVTGSVPRQRPRCFLFQTPDRTVAPHPVPPDAAMLYKEVRLDLDTLWLFPHLERGVLIARGVAEVMDDEARDVGVVQLVWENPAEAAGTPESYLEQLRRSLDRTQKVDLSAVELARKEAEEIRLKAAKLKEKLEETKARLLRLEPPEPVALDVAGMAATVTASLATAAATLEQAVALRNRIAPQVPINQKRVQQAMSQAKQSLAHLTQVAADGQKAQAAADAKRAEMEGQKAELEQDLLQNETFRRLGGDASMLPVWPTPGDPPLKLRTPPPEVQAQGAAAVAGWAYDDMSAQAQELAARLASKKETLSRSMTRVLGQRGIDPAPFIEAMNTPTPEPADPFAVLRNANREAVAETKRLLDKSKLNTPSLTAHFEQQAARQEQQINDSEKLYKDGMKRLSDFQAQLDAGGGAMPVPQWAQDLAAGAGIDLNEPAGPLTRLQVEERVAAGKSLAGRNMAGQDLSGMDLRGADLSQANLLNASLTGAKLDGADLTGAKCMGADLTGASLPKAKLDGAVFMNAKMPGAVLAGTTAAAAIFRGADLAKADFSGAKLNKAIFDRATAPGAVFKQADATKALLTNADLSGADFSGSNLTQACLYKTKAGEADFSKADLSRTLFWSVEAPGARFCEAEMFNSRIGGKSRLTGADFSGIRLREAHWRDSDLSAAVFTGATLERTTFDSCNLRQAVLAGVAAPNCRFPKSDLGGANLAGINLHQGSLRKASIEGANLAGANLYNVEFMYTRTGGTDLRGANLKRTKLEGREDLLREGGNQT